MDLRTHDRTSFAAPRYVVETLRAWRCGTGSDRQQLRLIADVGRRRWTVAHTNTAPGAGTTAAAYPSQDEAMDAIETTMIASGAPWAEISPFTHPWA